MHKLANVALPVAIDSTFTYMIPPELEHSAVVGVRVVVPFGRKYATGMIVDLPSSSTVTALKPIKDVIDASPIVSDELLRLCLWIANYYVTPLGEVLKASIPHGFTSASKRIVRLTASVNADALATAMRTSKQRAQLLELLAGGVSVASNDLQKKTGLRNINTILNEFVAAGLIETEEILAHYSTKPVTKDFVEVHRLSASMIEEITAALPRRKKNAHKLMATLAAMVAAGVNEVSVSDLLKKSGTTSATMKEFKANGLLSIVVKEIQTQQEFGTEEQTLSITLNASQQNVLTHLSEAVDSGEPKTFLLHGVTGSGKTQVYIEAIRHCMKKGKNALVLVPEISLTPQIVRRFKSHFGDAVAVVHSRMSANERNAVWLQARRGDCRVVIGPRSAVFAPLRNLGLLVVDEEHEPSYKQFDASPRYNARDVAIVRGSFTNAAVVLGSATPSAESYFNAMSGKHELLEMQTRVEEVSMPAITIVDMIEERKREFSAAKELAPPETRSVLREFHQSSFSTLLRGKIEDRLQKREGIILLQNRRGFAPFIECLDCGTTTMCPNCNVTLTYHLPRKHLRCHYCGLTQKPPVECPHCKGMNLLQRGAGTQRVEQELVRLFPHANVLRMDMDTTTRRGAHHRLLEKFASGEADILLGTQMVAKGLDFARVTLVGVISADTQMLLPDFRSSERTFQLLTQVAGRAGRSTLQGEVVIQTHQPRHYTLQHVVDHNFKAFMDIELEERRELGYPPFSRLALIEFKGKNETSVQSAATEFARVVQSISRTLLTLGPSPAVISKINNLYRWQIIIKSLKATDPSGAELHYVIRKAAATVGKVSSSIKRIIDIDPAGLM